MLSYRKTPNKSRKKETCWEVVAWYPDLLLFRIKWSDYQKYMQGYLPIMKYSGTKSTAIKQGAKCHWNTSLIFISINEVYNNALAGRYWVAYQDTLKLLILSNCSICL